MHSVTPVRPACIQRAGVLWPSAEVTLSCRFPNQITNLINGKVALTRIQAAMQVGPFKALCSMLHVLCCAVLCCDSLHCSIWMLGRQ